MLLRARVSGSGGWSSQSKGQSVECADIEGISVHASKQDCGNEGNISSKVTCTKTKAYRNVKHNFVVIVGEKVKDGRRS